MSNVERNEARYWDDQARKVSENALGLSDGPPTALDRCRLELLGDVRDKKVLDVGCGTGGWSIKLALAGADVCAVDISPESIRVTQQRASTFGVASRVEARRMSATSLDYPAETFDLIHGQDIVHHMPDCADFGREIARVLRDEGTAVFTENSSNNRLLMFARDHLCGRFGIPKWSSDDEYPLSMDRLASFASAFGHLEVRYPQFLCFFYVDAKLFGYKNRLVSRVCSGIDSTIYHWVPSMRRYSYRQVFCVQKPLR